MASYTYGTITGHMPTQSLNKLESESRRSLLFTYFIVSHVHVATPSDEAICLNSYGTTASPSPLSRPVAGRQTKRQ